MPFAARLAQFLRLLRRIGRCRRAHGRGLRSGSRCVPRFSGPCGAKGSSASREDRQIDVPDDPLFIVGHWRSGTTYLHYLLALDRESFAYPSNYQCLFPTVFLTLARTRGCTLAARPPTLTRPMDGVCLGDRRPRRRTSSVYLAEGGSSPFHESMSSFPRATARVDPATRSCGSRPTPAPRTSPCASSGSSPSSTGAVSSTKSPGHLFRLPDAPERIFSRNREPASC